MVSVIFFYKAGLISPVFQALTLLDKYIEFWSVVKTLLTCENSHSEVHLPVLILKQNFHTNVWSKVKVYFILKEFRNSTTVFILKKVFLS